MKVYRIINLCTVLIFFFVIFFTASNISNAPPKITNL